MMLGLVNCKACRGISDQSVDTVKVSFPLPNDDERENEVLSSFGRENEVAAGEEHVFGKVAEQRVEEQRSLELEERRQEEQRLAQQREEEKRVAEEEEKLQQQAIRKQLEEAEKVRKRERVQQWLAKYGFSAVNEKKKKRGMLSSGYKYPLHAAVKAEDAAAIRLLLWAGADKSLEDSAKLTPLALAGKLGKKGSHKQVVAALQE